VRLAALGEVIICSGVPTQIALGWLLVPLLADDPERGALTLAVVGPLLLLDTLVVIALMVWFTRARGERVRDVWLGSRGIASESRVGLLLVPVVFVLAGVLLNAIRLLAPALRNVPVNPLEQMATGGAMEAAIFGVVAVIGGGVREELQRAFMLRRFEQHLGGAAVGVVLLSLAFGLGHVQQGLDAVITTGVLGAFWAVVYLRRRSAVAPVVSHAGFNGLEVFRVAIGGA
jgi:membrane protease YdiL (CAAX protease family)